MLGQAHCLRTDRKVDTGALDFVGRSLAPLHRALEFWLLGWVVYCCLSVVASRVGVLDSELLSAPPWATVTLYL